MLRRALSALLLALVLGGTGAAVAQAAGTLTGTITGPGGAPVANSHYYVFRTDGTLAADPTADAAGHYAIDLAAGDYKIQFSPSFLTGLQPEYYKDAATFDDATVVTLTDGATMVADGEVGPGASIAGTVTADGGGPLAGVEVDLFRNGLFKLSVRTGDDGSYTIGGLAAGTYAIGAETTGNALGEFYDDAATLDTATPIVLADGEQRGAVDLALAAGGGIAGTITDAAGAPLAGA